MFARPHCHRAHAHAHTHSYTHTHTPPTPLLPPAQVHERSLDSDVLLARLRDVLKHRRDLKVVLMSATLDADKFSRYFGGAPVISIPGFTHPVKELYLEDLYSMVKPRLTLAHPETIAKVRTTNKKNRRVLPPLKVMHRKRHAQTDSQTHTHTDRQTDRRTHAHTHTPPSGLQKHKWMARAVKGEEASGVDSDIITGLTALEAIDYGLIANVVDHILHHGDEGAILVFMPGRYPARACILALCCVAALPFPTALCCCPLGLHAKHCRCSTFFCVRVYACVCFLVSMAVFCAAIVMHGRHG